MPPNTNKKNRSNQASSNNPALQLVERLGTANNVLVTVSNNPSVDQLAACIGLTIALNKQGKHATAVFSGKIPSTIEFLQPDKTIETNTNSLRDFIISLDKSKADKLRYKVEDDYVKIFITPYRTSLSQDDLNFSEGDFNVDLIITLGVHERTHLDGAIVAHGRILHDATVASLTTDTPAEIGSINWAEPKASSLCEMVSDLIVEVNKSLIDSQIATALLTGLVAETDRFGNEKAHPHTMSVSGVLMAAGASPQLISDKLQEAQEPGDEIPEVVDEEAGDSQSGSVGKDGTIRIDHTDDIDLADGVGKKQAPKPEEPTDDIHIDEQGRLKVVKDLHPGQKPLDETPKTGASNQEEKSRIVLEPPKLSGQLTANTIAEHEQSSPSTDPLSAPPTSRILKRDDAIKDDVDEDVKEENFDGPVASANTAPKPIKKALPQIDPDQTLIDIERSVNSSHLQQNPDQTQDPLLESVDPKPDNNEPIAPIAQLDDARAAVETAANLADSNRPAPLDSLGSTPVNLDLGHDASGDSPSDLTPDSTQPPTQTSDNNPGTPPPVPPPLPPSPL